MKKLIIIISLIFWGIVSAGETSANHGVSGYFYNGLSPYGTWIEIDYGVVVWRPTVMRVDWSPYYDGRWIWTTDGWYWYSYEPFGDITYHYGRWYFDDYYGWLWYPDYDWAPAWVEWRYDNDYIGWAPLHPYAIFTIGVGIYFSTTYYTPYYHWHFVNYNFFYDPYVYNHCVGPKFKYRIYTNTRYRTNYDYHNGRIRNSGVSVDFVRTRGGHNIRVRNLERDPNFVSLDRNGFKEEGKIRTYYRTRDELTSNEVRDVKFERSERKSNLDVTRLDRRELRDRKTSFSNERVERNEKKDRNKELVTRDKKTNTDKNREVKTYETRKNTNTEFKRNTTEKKNRTDVQKNRNIEKKKEVRTNKDLNNQVKRDNNKKTEVKINQNNKQKQEVKTFRNNQQKKEIKVNRNTQKKNTVKTDRNTTKRNNVNTNKDRNNTRRKR